MEDNPSKIRNVVNKGAIARQTLKQLRKILHSSGDQFLIDLQEAVLLTPEPDNSQQNHNICPDELSFILASITLLLQRKKAVSPTDKLSGLVLQAAPQFLAQYENT